MINDQAQQFMPWHNSYVVIMKKCGQALSNFQDFKRPPMGFESRLTAVQFIFFLQPLCLCLKALSCCAAEQPETFALVLGQCVTHPSLERLGILLISSVLSHIHAPNIRGYEPFLCGLHFLTCTLIRCISKEFYWFRHTKLSQEDFSFLMRSWKKSICYFSTLDSVRIINTQRMEVNNNLCWHAKGTDWTC